MKLNLKHISIIIDYTRIILLFLFFSKNTNKLWKYIFFFFEQCKGNCLDDVEEALQKSPYFPMGRTSNVNKRGRGVLQDIRFAQYYIFSSLFL